MRPGSSVGMVGVIAAVLAVLGGLAGPSAAGTVTGKLELPPPPERGPVVAKGFVDRVENPLADIKRQNLAPYFLVALESDAPAAAAPAAVAWDLVGESFARPVIGVPVGAEVVIKNVTKIARTLGAAEDAKLIVGPLNPTGTKSFRATQPAIYTIGDKDAPHLRGKVVVVATSHVAGIDDGGRFELTDVAEGSYKLRIFYYNPAAEAKGQPSGWLALVSDVAVTGKPRTEVNVKVPAAALAPAAPGKK